jgi:predicted nucleic acid-binding protein
MIVVADTSPLNYLVWIDSVEIVPQLYGKVVIPPEALNELQAADAPSVVRAWANDLPDWIEVRVVDPARREDPRWQTLDPGERAALSLASADRPSLLLRNSRKLWPPKRG